MDELSLVYQADKQQPHETPLCIFTKRQFDPCDGLHSCHHYNYDRFREWLEDVCGVPKHMPINIPFTDGEGKEYDFTIKDQYAFATALHRLKYGFAVLPANPRSGLCMVMFPCEDILPSVENAASALESGPLNNQPPIAPPMPDVSSAAGPDLMPDRGIKDPALDEQQANDNHKGDHPPEIPGDQSVREEPEVVVIPDDDDNEQDEPNAGGLIFFDDAILAKAERFFQTSRNTDGKYKVKGIRRPLHMYQLYTTYGVLAAPFTTGVNGGFIGWDVGFGKTMLVLVYLRARAKLAALWSAVRLQWKTQPGKDGDHLDNKEQPPNARCPTQNKLMVECPCVASSDSRQICETYLTNTPAMIVMPPALALGWLKEARAVYVDEKRPDRVPFITFYTCVSSIKDCTSLNTSSDPRRWASVIADTQAELVIQKFDDNFETQLDQYVQAGNGTATDVFLVSNKYVETLYRKYPKPDGNKPTRFFTVGLVVMDEHQTYKGSATAVKELPEGIDSGQMKPGGTLPFKVLGKISQNANHPVTLLTLCGTTLEEGPTAWGLPIQHFMGQWAWFKPCEMDQLRCAKDKTPCFFSKTFTEIRRTYLTIVRQLASKAKTEEQLEPELRNLVTTFKPIIWRLRQGQLRRGQAINPLPPCHKEYRIVEPMMDETTTTAFNNMVSSITVLVEKKLESLISQWNGSDKSEPRPTKESVPPKEFGVFDHQNGRQPQCCFSQLTTVLNIPLSRNTAQQIQQRSVQGGQLPKGRF